VKDGKTTPFQLTAQAGGCLQVVAAVAQEDVTAPDSIRRRALVASSLPYFKESGAPVSSAAYGRRRSYYTAYLINVPFLRHIVLLGVLLGRVRCAPSAGSGSPNGSGPFSGHGVRGRCGLLGQRDELVMVEVGELHSAGFPVGLRLLDPLLREGHEVPVEEALAERLAAEQHDL
jgi:hypothetical protein